MSSAVDMLKLTEAAVVAHVALREVNRVIDERILPDCFISTDDGRRVATAACPLISFYFDSARRLTAEDKSIEFIANNARAIWIGIGLLGVLAVIFKR